MPLIPFAIAIINLNIAEICFPATAIQLPLLAQKGQTAEELVQIGIAKSELKDSKGAIADFTKAIQISPNSPSAYGLRAQERQSLGDLKGAITDMNELIKISPNVAESYSARAQMKSALKDKSGAISDYTEALKLIPDDSVFYYERGKIKSEIGDSKGAIADFNQTIELSPVNSEAYQSRGELRDKLGDKKGAIADLVQARQTEAKNYVGTINRYSQVYAIEQKKMPPNLEVLKIREKPKNNTYRYTFQKVDQNMIITTAISTQSGLTNYIGATTYFNENTFQAITCEASPKTNLANLIPKTINSNLTCPSGLTPIN